MFSFPSFSTMDPVLSFKNANLNCHPLLKIHQWLPSDFRLKFKCLAYHNLALTFLWTNLSTLLLIPWIPGILTLLKWLEHYALSLRQGFALLSHWLALIPSPFCFSSFLIVFLRSQLKWFFIRKGFDFLLSGLKMDCFFHLVNSDYWKICLLSGHIHL